MFKRVVRFIVIVLVIFSLSFALMACGSSEKDAANVACDIGITESENTYTAVVDITEDNWNELTEKQQNNVVDQCLDTIDISSESNEEFELIGVDKATEKQIFTYDSTTQEINFGE